MDFSLISASSSSSSNTPPSKYEVFLSFRGEDTRSNFTSHLHRALCDKKIETFIDYELRRGDEISPSLLKAIEDSQISIIIFSKGYASSRWCLEELVKILECKKMYGQIVIPIFYEVDPSDVRNQTGSFADAFAEHERRFKESLDKVQRWKDALKQAANLSGSDSRVVKPESVLIEAVVQDVLKRLTDLSSTDTNDLVGIDSRIQEIESLLCFESKDFRSVGLWGMGGIGKTTLVGAVYDKISSQFEGSVFIENVREESEQNGGLNRLRRELLSAILGDETVSRGSSFTASNFAKKRLARKKLLIVFDDVTSFRQIESLIRGLDCFSSESRIIITTRDKQVLKNCRVNQIYKVDELFDHNALTLFCLYAFGQSRPKEDYEQLSHRVVEYVGGVPLALKVLGSSLLDKGKEVWESAMNKLEEIFDKDIHMILRISFDGLDDNEQNIFLDIACFLKGRSIYLVKDFLDACGFFTEVGISALIDKSLITITNNTLTMHDLLQAMGREIVRQESNTDAGKRSRLWHHKDIYNVLTDNTGTETIVGISLDMSETRDIHLNPCAFTKMRKLRFLNFDSSRRGKNANKVQVFDGLESVFTKLRYLHWLGCPFKSLSSNFQSENLVVLNMRYSQVEQLWNGPQQLVNLKQIDLSHSKRLTSCPNLSGALNLVSLNLAVTSLCEIPKSSIQHLSKLNYLNLNECKKLRVLPDCTGLKSLKKLHLGRCSSLKMLPELPCNIEELKLLGSAIEELPSSFKYLSKLVTLDLSSSNKLRSLQNDLSKLTSLKRICLTRCSKLDKLPDEIGTLDSLRDFEAKGIAIREVPSSIMCLNNLQKLSLERCKGQDMVGLLLPPLLGLPSMRELDLTDCAITKLPDSLGSLSSLKELYLGRNNFESIPASIKNLSNLQYLDISYCEALQSLPELPLISTNAYNCVSLEVISRLSVQDRTVAIGSPFIKVDLINCFKLDRNVLIGEALLKLQSLAILWKENYYYKDPHVPPLSTVICFPGSEVPEQFNFQNLGSFVTVELPPDWLNNNFVGFALCAVVAFRDHEDSGLFLDINFECELKSEDGQCHVAHGTLGDWNIFRSRGQHYKIGSDHVYMGFDSTNYLDDIDELCYEVSFQFYLEGQFGKRIECCKVKECGVRLMYAQDIGEPSGSFNSDDNEDEFWESMEEPNSSLNIDEEAE
ncbi:hypothetical protein ACOSQ2_009339 [Xanthoceras sorbifolium]